MRDYPVAKSLRGRADVLIDDSHACARCKIRPDFPDSRIKSGTRVHCGFVIRSYRESSLMPTNEIQQVRMRNLYTLWPAGRSRSEDDVRQLRSISVANLTAGIQIQSASLHDNRLPTPLWQLLSDTWMGHDQPNAGVFQEHSQPVFGVARIKWYIGCTSFQHAERADDKVRGAPHT